MSTTTQLDDDGDFGLSCTFLSIQPGAAPGPLLFDAVCLLDSALEVFEEMGDKCGASPTHFAGVYLLRQAAIALRAGQAATEMQLAAVDAPGSCPTGAPHTESADVSRDKASRARQSTRG